MFVPNSLDMLFLTLVFLYMEGVPLIGAGGERDGGTSHEGNDEVEKIEKRGEKEEQVEKS